MKVVVSTVLTPSLVRIVHFPREILIITIPVDLKASTTFFKNMESSFARRCLPLRLSLQRNFHLILLFSVRNNLLHWELKTGVSVCGILKKINSLISRRIVCIAKIEILLKLLAFIKRTKTVLARVYFSTIIHFTFKSLVVRRERAKRRHFSFG